MPNNYLPGVDKRKVRLYGVIYTLILLGFILGFLYWINRDSAQPLVKNLLHDYYSVNGGEPLYLLVERGGATEEEYLQAARLEYGGRMPDALLRQLLASGDLTRNEQAALREQAFYQAGTIKLEEQENGIYAYTCEIQAALSGGTTETRQASGVIAISQQGKDRQIIGLVPSGDEQISE